MLAYQSAGDWVMGLRFIIWKKLSKHFMGVAVGLTMSNEQVRNVWGQFLDCKYTAGFL